MQEKKPNLPQSMGRGQERDDFWDIDKLIPDATRPKRVVSQPSRHSTDAVELDVPPPTRQTPTNTPPHTAQPITIPHSEPRSDHGGGAYPTHHGSTTTDTPAEEPALVYEAEGRLLHTVKVYTWRTNYHYFDQFINDAVKYASMKGRETRKEPFFSYFPQYAQMNRRQLGWYLWWRDNTRQEVYLETDYAYVLLYLFELLNLPVEHDQAEEVRDTMAKVWMVYRKAYPQLDHYMCEWLCDYCLIHRLTAPVAILLPALGDVIATARLKEFYLSAMISVGNQDVNLASARILLSYCCQYDYRKSKFAGGEHKAMFDTLIPGAIAATFPLILGEKDHPAALTMDDSYISRDAYVGALCAYSNKRRIEIAYTSFSRSHDLRFLIGDMVRHTENRLRGSIGIRSRLTTHFLSNSVKNALDAWLNPRLPQAPTATEMATKNQPRPAYEALYDLPHTEVSLASADEIEKSSWETTRILTEAFEDEQSMDITAIETEQAPTQPTTTTPITHDESTPVVEDTPTEIPQTNSELLTALGDRVIFLKAVMEGDRAGQNAYCREKHRLPDAVADEINDLTTTFEVFDMVLENTGAGYTIIEDYREIINDILKN